MSAYSDIIMLVLIMLASGVLSGVMAGLLGIGGGIVVVPILEYALSHFGVGDEVRMHIAVATSLAIIILTSFSSAKAHYKKGMVDLEVIKNWTPAILIGAVSGSWLASKLDGKMLVIIFAFLALFVALKMLFGSKSEKKIRDELPDHFAVQLMPLSIGCLSSMMGIGGGVMGVSFLTLFGVNIHRAVSTAAVFGLLISIPGTVNFIITGLKLPDLPLGNIGYVNLIGLGIIAPAAYLAAPLGAKIAHNLSRRKLNIVFGLFLFTISTQMLYRYLA